MPYKVWNNAKGISDFQFGGYCTHSSILFTTWHRPYLALFEVMTTPSFLSACCKPEGLTCARSKPSTPPSRRWHRSFPRTSVRGMWRQRRMSAFRTLTGL